MHCACASKYPRHSIKGEGSLPKTTPHSYMEEKQSMMSEKETAAPEKETLELVLPAQDVTEPPKKKVRRRKSCTKRCLVSCLICLLVLALFVGGIITASALVFNRFVSPRIGGVDFLSTVRLMRGLYNGERNRNKILTDTATEEDLYAFYDELYAHLFVKSLKSADAFAADYDAFDDAQKADVAAQLLEDGEWAAKYNAASDSGKDAIARDYYVKTHRYPITVTSLLAKVDLGDLTGGGSETAAAGDEEPEAGEGEEGPEVGATGSEGSSIAGLDLASLLDGIAIDIRDNPALAKFDYTKDADYADNVAAVTMQISGKEITAVLSEVMKGVLSKIDMSSLTEGLGAADLDITQYVRIPQVVITSDFDGTDLTEEERRAAFDKNVCLSATVELRIGDLLSSGAAQSVLSKTIGESVSPSMIKVILSVVKGALPKTLFLTAGIYPYDDSRDMLVKINNYSAEDQANMIKIVNAVMGGDFLGGESSQSEDGEAEAEKKGSVFTQLNARAVELFAKLDELGAPVSFYETQSDNGRSVGLSFAHIQLLLHFLQLDGEDGVSPYDLMTVLKCLFSEVGDGNAQGEADFTALYTELEQKYGIAAATWEDKGLLGTLTDDAGNVLKNINLSGDFQFKENDKMRVTVKDTELVAMFADAIQSLAGGSETAAAGDSSDMLSSLKDSLQFTEFSIRAEDTDLYSFTFKVNIGIDQLLGDVLKEESGIMNTLKDTFPDNMSIGLTLYTKTEDGVIKEYSPEGHSISYLINSFDATYTQRVLDTITKLMSKLGGSEITLDSLGAKINEVVEKVFDTVNDTLHCSLRVQAGGLQLPSLYEIIHGFGEMQVESKDALTAEDLPSIDRIRNVLTTIYNFTPSAASVQGTEADALISTLRNNYYLKADISAEDLFNGSNLSDKFSGDFFDTQKLFADDRPLSQLSVPIDANALADLVQKSGKTDGISVEGLVNSVSIVGSNYSRDGGNLYLNMTFAASFAQQESGESSELSVSQFMPERLYITAVVLLHNDTDTYSIDRFTTDIVINENNVATSDLLRLAKVFTGNEINTSSVSTTVKDAIGSAFSTVEGNLLVTYTQNGATEERMILSDVFTYLTEGKLTTEGGSTHYDRSQHMKNSDASDTTPTQLMNRLRELGKADTADNFGANMVVWSGKAPAETGDKYNDNIFVGSTAEDDFYTQLKEGYFFKEKPSAATFTADNNIFSDLSQDTLGDYFRLVGNGTNGLYNYTGDQVYAILSDKAMGSLIKNQNAVSVNSDYVKSVEVTSLKMQVIGSTLRVELTCLVETQNNALLPQKFYLTTVSQKAVAALSDKSTSFTTTMALNRFTPEDLADLFANTAFLSTINLNDTIQTQLVTDNVSSALNELFADKLKGYAEGYENFDDPNDARGKGYIRFYTVYHKIVDTLGIVRASYPYADTDIQGAIVSLHKDNDLLYAINPSGDASYAGYGNLTDRAFANLIKQYNALGYEKPDSVQSIIFAGNSDKTVTLHKDEENERVCNVYQEWATLLGKVGGTAFTFTDTPQSKYVVATACFKTTGVTSGVSLLPEEIYSTVVYNGSTTEVDYIFINDMTVRQTEMILSCLGGTMEQKSISGTVTSLITLYKPTATYVQSDDFDQCIGYLQ